MGEAEGLGGEAARGARWVGVRLDEPMGRNDGSVRVKRSPGDGDGVEAKEEMKRLFDCRPGFGLVVRPEKVEVGEQWTPLDDLGMDMDDEEEEEEEEL